jgi:hypothetical protein
MGAMRGPKDEDKATAEVRKRPKFEGRRSVLVVLTNCKCLY